MRNKPLLRTMLVLGCAAPVLGCGPSADQPSGQPRPASRAAGAAPRGAPGEPAARRPATVWDRLRAADWQVRKAAVDEIAASKRRRALTALARRLQDRHPAVSRAAAAALVRHGKDAIPALVAQIRRSKPAVRKKILGLLGSRPERQAVLGLVRLLEAGDPEVRAEAAKVLTQLTDQGKVAILRESLGRASGSALTGLVWALRSGTVRGVRGALIQRLARARGTFDRHNVLSLLVATDPAWYGEVARALRRTEAPVVQGIVLALAYELESLGRIRHAAGQLGDETLAKWAAAETGRYVAALQGAGVHKVLMRTLRAKAPRVALGAGTLLKALGRRARLKRARRAYLKQLRALAKDPKNPPDVRLRAYVRLGHDAWVRSCKVAPVHGLCVKMSYKQHPKEPLKRRQITYVKRKAKLVQKARQAFASAWKLWNGGALVQTIPDADPQRSARVARARHDAAWARFMTVEVDLEDYLRLGVPDKLDFNPRDPDRARDSMRRFGAWLRTKLKTGEKLIKGYMAVVTRVRTRTPGARSGGRQGSRYWSVAAVSRTGAVFRNFGQLLLGAPVPAFLTGAEARMAYAEQMHKFADPLISKAAQRFRICLDMSSIFNWYWEWALACPAGLAATDPATYSGWQNKNRAYLTRLLPVTAGVLSAEVPRQAVISARTAIDHCYREHGGGGLSFRRRRPSARQVTFQLEIDPRGRVTQAALSGQSGPPEAAACALKVIRGLRFPPHPGPTVKVTVPYVIR